MVLEILFSCVIFSYSASELASSVSSAAKFLAKSDSATSRMPMMELPAPAAFSCFSGIAGCLMSRGGTGVRGFTKIYGSKSRISGKRYHNRRAAKGLIRSGLQALQSLKLVEVGKNGGRYLTKTGRKQLDQVAGTVDAPKPFAFIPEAAPVADDDLEAPADDFQDQDQSDDEDP